MEPCGTPDDEQKGFEKLLKTRTTYCIDGQSDSYLSTLGFLAKTH